MRAVGITSGIGSMLIGARAAGFDVAGNVEWRDYYHLKDNLGQNTFEQNFPGVLFPTTLEGLELNEIEKFMGADLAMGHPECGRFSTLSGAVVERAVRAQDPGDIPLFVDLIARLEPRFFVMDDLPKSLSVFPMASYHEKLPGYDLYPEWVSNWGYGNVQKGRNRFFVIGSKKEERWAFVPGEAEHSTTVADVIGDLPKPRRGSNLPNHDPHDNSLYCFQALHLGERDRRLSWAEVGEYFRDKPGGHVLRYKKADGSETMRIGFLKGHWNGPAHVLTGGSCMVHPIRCDPLTIRERARIQGFPDDFVFYGTPLDGRGRWNNNGSRNMLRQTGKAMPVQFSQFVSEQIAARVQSQSWDRPPGRVIHSNEDVDRAKRWYCGSVGYADQERACGACWMTARCEIRTDRWGLPPLVSRAVARTQGAESGAKPLKSKRGSPDRVTHDAPLPRASHKVDIVREPIHTKIMSFTGGKR